MPRPLTIWLLALALGAGAALLAAAFGILGFFVVLLVIPGMRGRTALAAMSGALIGFGAVWLARLAVLGSEPGQAGNDALPLLVGIVPLALGLTFGLVALVLSRRGPG
jgi:hypothetical protein